MAADISIIKYFGFCGLNNEFNRFLYHETILAGLVKMQNYFPIKDNIKVFLNKKQSVKYDRQFLFQNSLKECHYFIRFRHNFKKMAIN